MSDHHESRSGSGESLALPLTRCAFSDTQSSIFSSLLLAFLMISLYLVWDPNRFRDSPQLVALLKEMKDGLDVVRSKVDVLTQKVVGVCCASILSLFYSRFLFAKFFVKRFVLLAIKFGAKQLRAWVS